MAVRLIQSALLVYNFQLAEHCMLYLALESRTADQDHYSPPNAHVNFQYISCAAYKRCGSYRCPPSGGYNGVRSGGLHFDP